MELVTHPDISSGAEAKKFCEELQLIFRYLGISNADMEKGQMRCEVNISLSKSEKLGTKVEIKNLNSFKAVEKSIDYEIKRQGEILEKGEKIILPDNPLHRKPAKAVTAITLGAGSRGNVYGNYIDLLKEETHGGEYNAKDNTAMVYFWLKDLKGLKDLLG